MLTPSSCKPHRVRKVQWTVEDEKPWTLSEQVLGPVRIAKQNRMWVAVDYEELEEMGAVARRNRREVERMGPENYVDIVFPKPAEPRAAGNRPTGAHVRNVGASAGLVLRRLQRRNGNLCVNSRQSDRFSRLRGHMSEEGIAAPEPVCRWLLGHDGARRVGP